MRIAFFSFALLTSSAVMAATPIDGWYSGIFGGYTYIPDIIDVTKNGLTRSFTTLNGGYHAGASFGYKIQPLRYEGEITYLKAELAKFSINGIPQGNVDGYSSGVFAMANIYYDFPAIVPCLEPYLGIGAGYGWVHVDMWGTSNVYSPYTPYFLLPYRTQFTDSSSVFAYQGMAGVTFNFSENYSSSLSYRYIGTSSAEAVGHRFEAHSISVGVVYRFDGFNYK